MKFSYVVTLDAPDVQDTEATADQVETARLMIERKLVREVAPAGIHVTVTVQRGLPFHPFPAP